MKSLQLSKPHLLVVIGIPGAGKSAFAAKFTQTFSAPFIDYAELRDLAGDMETASKIADYAMGRLLLTKQTIVIDGRGNRLTDRRELTEFAHKAGYTPFFIWVQTEPATAEHRAVRSKAATMSLSEFDARAAEFQVPGKSEPIIVISGKHTYASQARMVLKRLAGEHTAAVESKIETPPPRQMPIRGRFIR